MTGSDPAVSPISPATFLKRLTTGVFLINLFVVALLALSLRQSLVQYEERSAISTGDLSQILAQNLDGTIDKIDLVLLAVADEVKRQVAGGGIDIDTLNSHIARQYGRIPELDGLRMTNAQGDAIFGTGVVPGSLQNMSDRDYFLYARNNSKGELFISKPVFGRIAKKWVINISRRVSNPDGSFVGVVYAPIALEHFQKMFSRITVGPKGNVVLVNGDFGFITRYPAFQGDNGAIGQKKISRELQELLRSGHTSGTYKARTGPDRIERKVSYRKVADYPLYVIVALASEDYLEEWRNVVNHAIGLALFFALSSLLSSWFVYRNWKRRVSAVKDLVSSKEQIRILLESTAEAIYGVDLHGCCTFANPACVRLLGYDHPDELLGRQLHDICHHTHPDGKPFPVQDCRISNSFKDGTGIHVDDEVFWRRDGSSFPIECWSYPQWKNNEVIGAVVTFLDITDRKRAEAELHESRQQLLDIIDFLPDATFVIDTEGKVIAWNKAMEQMSGVGKADMLGQGDHAYTVPFYGERRLHLLDLLDIDDAELEHKYQHVQRKGNTLNAEAFTPALYGGKGAHVWAVGAPLYNTEGVRVGAIEAIRDISAHKQAEATISKYREHLEELVERRTQELVGAKEAAEAASRAKSEFMAAMSHELRTPLNAIIGFSDLALQSQLTAKQQNYVSTIQNAGNSLLGMINDILDFSRSEEGTLVLERTRFQLDDVLARVIAVAQQKAVEKGLDLLVAVSPHLPQQVDGDHRRLGQVLSHLLDNAVKFTAKGEVELALELMEQSEDAVMLRFVVRDSGIGMQPEQIRKLFQLFTQVDGSATRKFGGRGVGLTICRRLAALMGGDIAVESIPGNGSIFTFDARFGHVPAPAALPAEDVNAGPARGPFPWIDTAYTLKWAAGHEKLYREIAAKFRRDHHDIPDRLAAAIRAGDHQEGGRIAHVLAGLAGCLGVTALREAALEVEQALLLSRDASGSLERMTPIFRDLIAKLTFPGGDEGIPAVGCRGDGADVGAILDRLERYALDCDGESFGYFESVVATLRSALPAAPWDEISRFLERYEFEEAAGLLRKVVDERE